MAEKLCSSCKTTKPLDQFEKDPRYKSGHRSQCHLCRQAGLFLSKLDWRMKNVYGISAETYFEMEAAQAGLCAICGKVELRKKRKATKREDSGVESTMLSVDHDAGTGKVRGLLCMRCNTGIGHFLHDPDLLMAAIMYLEEHR